MAKKYKEDIKRVQPEGPYNLVGWSLGGNIAYEVATQLTADG
ncbi:MAG: thioesterase domain-containing protein [Arenicella sp.]